MTVTLNGNDIYLTDGADQIRLDGMADGSGQNGVAQVQFADGTVWTATQIISSARTISATTYTLSLHDALPIYFFDGGPGVRYEQSNGGADTFLFNQGYGHLEI